MSTEAPSTRFAEVDRETASTAKLVRHAFDYLNLSWGDLAKAMSTPTEDVKANFLINVSRGRSRPSPRFRARLIAFCDMMAVRGLEEFLQEDETIEPQPTLSNLATALGISADAYSRTHRRYSGYYNILRRAEDGTVLSTWAKLLEKEDGIGVPRYLTWRPSVENISNSVITTGYYFSSERFLYMLAHAFQEMSIRYSVLQKMPGGDLGGISCGVSSSNAMQASRVYLRRLGSIDDNLKRRAFSSQLGIFSAEAAESMFPKEVKFLTAGGSVVLPFSGDY